MVKNFYYTPPLVKELQRTLSAARLSTYLTATGGNLHAALYLYSWNADISGALYAPLQGLEIALRNALHNELSTVYSHEWANSNLKCNG